MIQNNKKSDSFNGLHAVGSRNHLSSIRLSAASQAAFITAARDLEPVRGLTHGFYKYPARFSPSFVRAAIETFSEPGDLVLDNHVGGGTTIVEALALGRNAVGIDISALAEFVSTAKTVVYAAEELAVLEKWARDIDSVVNVHGRSIHFAEYAELGYYKHLNNRLRWRLRKAIEQALGGAMQLGSKRLEMFGRCVALRTAQWALDGRRKLPTVDEFRQRLAETAARMLRGAQEFSEAVRNHSDRPSARILQRSAIGIEDDVRLSRLPAPKLVITSPPYPGVHVLYHRWQVDGRKESPLPFLIANKLDGAGASYYTMGDRKNPELKTYFDNVRATMSSAAAIADKHTIFVQVVAFSDPTWQLPRYLETMEKSGLVECFMPALKGRHDGRLWRSVPGRRWYSDQRGETPGSSEVVLIHRRLPGAPARHAVRLPSRASSEASAGV